MAAAVDSAETQHRPAHSLTVPPLVGISLVQRRNTLNAPTSPDAFENSAQQNETFHNAAVRTSEAAEVDLDLARQALMRFLRRAESLRDATSRTDIGRTLALLTGDNNSRAVHDRPPIEPEVELLRLEVNVRFMRELLDLIVNGMESKSDDETKQMPSFSDADVETLRVQVDAYASWVDSEKLRLSAERHQQRQHHAQKPTSSVDENQEQDGSDDFTHMDDLRARLIQLPRIRVDEDENADGMGYLGTTTKFIARRDDDRNVLRRRQREREQLLGSRDANGENNLRGGSAISAIIERDRQIQEELSHNLAQQASRLKENMLDFQDKLRADADVLRDTDELMGDNLSRLQKERKGIKTVASRTCGTTLRIWAALGGAVLIAMFVLIFMRFVRAPVAHHASYHHDTHTHAHGMAEVSSHPEYSWDDEL